jgi:hypothetical protein
MVEMGILFEGDSPALFSRYLPNLHTISVVVVDLSISSVVLLE